MNTYWKYEKAINERLLSSEAESDWPRFNSLQKIFNKRPRAIVDLSTLRRLYNYMQIQCLSRFQIDTIIIVIIITRLFITRYICNIMLTTSLAQ